MPQLIRARSDGRLRAVALIEEESSEPWQGWLGMLDLDRRGRLARASWLLRNPRIRVAAIGDEFVAAGRAFGLNGDSLQPSGGVVRYDGDGNIRWTRAVEAADWTYSDVITLPGGEIVTLVWLPVKVPGAEGDAVEIGGEGIALLRFSAEGTLLAATPVASGTLWPILLPRADGSVLVLAWGTSNAYLASSPDIRLPEFGLAIVVTPSGEVRLLAVLTNGPAIMSASVLPQGGFAITGGIIEGAEATVIAPGQPGAVQYARDSDNYPNRFLAVFEDNGALRWSRRTAGSYGSEAYIVGVLPDGGTVLSEVAGEWLAIERQNGSFERIYARPDEYGGPHAFAVYGPDGQLRLFQHEPACGEPEYRVQTPPESLTIATGCILRGSVTLGIDQPRETPLRNGVDRSYSSSMALYRYIDR